MCTLHYFRDEVCVHIVGRTKVESLVDIWLLCVCMYMYGVTHAGQ